MNPLLLPRLSRRMFLRANGVCIALPFLESMMPRGVGAEPARPPRRLVCICTVLGWHTPHFFPTRPGSDYELPPYLSLLGGHRDRFTVFSGFAHAGTEASGHQSECSFLTGAPGPHLDRFRNTVSLDQFVAGKIGNRTRFPSLQLASAISRVRSLAVDPRGVNLPGEGRPSQLFARMFLQGSPEDLRREAARLAEGRSVLDAVREQAAALGRRVGAGDQEKLDEYLSSVREAEQRLAAMQAWAKTPKPRVAEAAPIDVTNPADHIARMNALFSLIPLALQTDSTRVITMLIGYSDAPMPLPGVTLGHHHLTHHGQVPEKLAQLRIVEEAEMKAVNGLLTKLRTTTEAGVPLLDNTAVLLGSNLGNANSHSTRRLPILLAGGRFRHGRHLEVAPATKPEAMAPLGNLFLNLLRWMDLEAETFGGGNGVVDGLEQA